MQRYCASAIALLLATLPGMAQKSLLKQQASVSYGAERVMPGYQYLGIGAEYRISPLRWLGLQAEASWFPHKESIAEQRVGYARAQFGGVALIGRRFKDVSLFLEAGGGVTKAETFGGNPNVYDDYITRFYPTIPMGMVVEVAVSRRWSMTFTGRDNLTYIGTYRVNPEPLAPPYTQPGGWVNSPEARAGIAFHF